jgi:hypothetical protein
MKTKYVCETCGFESEKAIAVSVCEKSHKKINEYCKIVKTEGIQRLDDIGTYIPIILTIDFEDITAEYIYQGNAKLKENIKLNLMLSMGKESLNYLNLIWEKR